MMWDRTEQRIERVERAVAQRHRAVVILEDIHDPHNAEAVFRTCDAMGIHHVHLVFERERSFDPLRMGRSASSTAEKWLDFTVHTSITVCVTGLQADGYQVCATVLKPDSESLCATDLTAPRVALMLGNEHRGLSTSAVELADRRLLIPMRGMVQSLNLSVTAALCMFELIRQREVRGMAEYLLSPEEQAALIERLLRR